MALSKKPAPTKKPTAKSPTAKSPKKSAPTFPGRLEIATTKGAVIEELPLASKLEGGLLVAAHLRGDELRAHLYVVHLGPKDAQDRAMTVLAYVKQSELGGKAGAALRVPQKGGWLWTPRAGFVFVVASKTALSREALIELLEDRAPEAKVGDDTNMAQGVITVPRPK